MAEESTPMLSAGQRKALQTWLEQPLDDDFADRVVGALFEDERKSPGEGREQGRPRRRFSPWLTLGTTLAAAALVWWMSGLPSHGEVGETVSGSDPTLAAAGTSAEPEVLELLALREHARMLLAARCSPCHDSASPDAHARALAAFDVRSDRWWETPSDRQLQRIGALVEEASIEDGDRDRFDAFVNAELRARTAMR